MAKPRVFISSTYYDLRSVRDDLDRFIRSMGFDPVRHERGQISYGKDDRLEEYAYREVDLCDLLVCIIGGKYGSPSASGTYSITQKELKTAIDQGKQVYIFVEDNVHSEFRYYLANKSVPGVKYTAVDNTKIFEFLEEIYSLPRGNPIFSFSVSSDITQVLQDQWAGLFQRLLIEHAARSQTVLIEELQRSLQTVGQLVQFLTEEKGKGEKVVQEILFANHPIFEAVRRVTNNPYRLYFTNLTEFNQWLNAARSFRRVAEFEADLPDYLEWRRVYSSKVRNEIQTLYVRENLFAKDGTLVPIAPASWRDEWIRLERSEPPKVTFPDMDDEIPF